MKKIRYIYFVLIILCNSSVFSQKMSSDTIEAESIKSRYFSDLDHSTYVELALFANGSFLYKFKFEAAGILKTKGKWKRTKRAIVLYNIEHVAGKPPTIFKRKWFISKNHICTEPNFEKENVICLMLQPCD